MRTATIPRKFKKAYGSGGVLDPTDLTQTKAVSTSGSLASALGAGSTLVGSIADAVDKGNSHGRQSGLTTGLKQGASMAATGASIGSVIPGVGTLAGGVVGGAIGLASGLIGSAGAAANERAEDRYSEANGNWSQLRQGQARIAGDPSLIYGNRKAQMFALGGQMTNDPPLSNKFKTEWNGFTDWMSKNGIAGDPKLDSRSQSLGNMYLNQYMKANKTTQLSPDSISRVQSEMQDYRTKALARAATGKIALETTPDKFMPNLSVVDGWLGSKTSKERFPNAYLNNKNVGLSNPTQTVEQDMVANMRPKKAYGGSISPQGNLSGSAMQVPGGTVTPLNSQAVAIDGKTHAQGGVQLPQAEVEDGETIANGFVFSEALGFAALHKPIAKAIGKIEAKPIDPVRRKTLEILDGREQGLMLSQEFLKQRLGIPSTM